MIGTTRAARQAKTGPEVYVLDGDGRRWAFAVDGLIRYAGSRDECERRLRLVTLPPDRPRQDHALGRIFT